MALKVHVMGNPGLPALFCVHGFASNAQIWRPLAEVLGDRFALHAVDLPGCGESPATDDDLDSVIDKLLRSAPTGAIWVGWSLGGMLALAAAATAEQGQAILDSLAESWAQAITELHELSWAPRAEPTWGRAQHSGHIEA